MTVARGEIVSQDYKYAFHDDVTYLAATNLIVQGFLEIFTKELPDGVRHRVQLPREDGDEGVAGMTGTHRGGRGGLDPRGGASRPRSGGYHPGGDTGSTTGRRAVARPSQTPIHLQDLVAVVVDQLDSNPATVGAREGA
jgi:hypothetical protein